MDDIMEPLTTGSESCSILLSVALVMSRDLRSLLQFILHLGSLNCKISTDTPVQSWAYHWSNAWKSFLQLLQCQFRKEGCDQHKLGSCWCSHLQRSHLQCARALTTPSLDARGQDCGGQYHISESPTDRFLTRSFHVGILTCRHWGTKHTFKFWLGAQANFIALARKLQSR